MDQTPTPWIVIQTGKKSFLLGTSECSAFFRLVCETGDNEEDWNIAKAELIASTPTILAERDALREEVEKLKAEYEELYKASKDFISGFCCEAPWNEPENCEEIGGCHFGKSEEDCALLKLQKILSEEKAES